MFMQLVIGAIGLGIVLMVGYLVVAQVRVALPATIRNPCYHLVFNGSNNESVITAGGQSCNFTAHPDVETLNDSLTIPDNATAEGILGIETTVFAALGLLAVSIIILAAFGLINVFK